MTINLTDYPLLSQINIPEDLRSMPQDQLTRISNELRSFLLNSVSKSSGHFASGLGTIELTVALHYVYNAPEDKLVWDVGHQAYPHKILTGRKNQIHTELERINDAFTQSEATFKETNSELRKELNKLERDYPRGQLDLEKGTLTYNPAIKEQMEQQAQQRGGSQMGNNGVDGGDVVDSPFVQV